MTHTVPNRGVLVGLFRDRLYVDILGVTGGEYLLESQRFIGEKNTQYIKAEKTQRLTIGARLIPTDLCHENLPAKTEVIQINFELFPTARVNNSALQFHLE